MMKKTRSNMLESRFKYYMMLLYNYRIEIVCALLCFVGTVLLSTLKYNVENEYEIDYTDCKDFHRSTTRCIDQLAYKNACVCILPLKLNEPLYSLTIFSQLKSRSVNHNGSYETKNLENGELSLTPLENCSLHGYNNGTKQFISNFNDTYSLIRDSASDYVPFIHTGLITEDEKAELNSDVQRKLVWRINHTAEYQNGIPADLYSLRIRYTSRCEGRRYVVFSSIHTVINWVQLYIAISLFVLGLIVITLKNIFMLKNRLSNVV